MRFSCTPANSPLLTILLAASASARIATAAANSGLPIPSNAVHVQSGNSVIPASATTATARLLSKSRLLRSNIGVNNDGPDPLNRNLAEDGEESVGWMVDYSIRFDSCHEIAAVGGEAGGREGEGQGQGLQKLIKFKLCPSDTCGSSCNGGAEYVTEMREFVESYLEAREEMEEQMCENMEQYCENYYSCDADDDEACLKTCLYEKGYGSCYENDEENDNNNNNNNNQEDFDIEQFLECEALNGNNDGNNNNNNYNGNANYYYTGAYCGSGGSAVYLGVFSDAACTVRADNSIFEKYMYTALPYSTTSLVGHDCLSCDASDYEEDDGNNNDNNNNNNNNNNDEDDILELCQELHERSAKCENKLNVESYNSNAYYKYYPHTESCKFIHSTLSSLESVSRTNGKSLTVARTFAWIFGLSTLGLVGFIVWDKVVKKDGRREIDLSSQGIGGTGIGETVRMS